MCVCSTMRHAEMLLHYSDVGKRETEPITWSHDYVWICIRMMNFQTKMHPRFISTCFCCLWSSMYRVPATRGSHYRINHCCWEHPRGLKRTLIIDVEEILLSFCLCTSHLPVCFHILGEIHLCNTVLHISSIIKIVCMSLF